MRSGIIASAYFRMPPVGITLRIDTRNTSTGSTDDRTFRIPTTGSGYLYRVNWDGEAVTRNHTGDSEYTFDQPGEKTVTIYGFFPRFYFNNTGDRLKVLSVDSWSNIAYSASMSNAFYGANNLEEIAGGANWFDTVTNAISMFRDTNLTNLPDDMTLDSLTIGSNMFNGTNLTTLPDGMTLSNLTNGSNMFIFVTINTERYSQLLIDMEANNPNNNVPFHGGNSKYNSSAVTARANLVARGWTITDGGLE